MKAAVFCTLLAIVTGAVSAVAAADEGAQPRRFSVYFGDLDLTHSPGAAVLYRRIRFAAKVVCKPEELRDFPAAHRCAEEAITRAVTDVSAPTLTSLAQKQMLVARR